MDWDLISFKNENLQKLLKLTRRLCPFNQGCGAGTGTGTGRNRIQLGIPEPYSEFGSGSGYKEMKKNTKKMY
jgi:hypothetical protein